MADWCVHNWIVDYVKKTLTCTKCNMVVNL